ncbi:PAS domain-containing protein [Pelagibius sp.]|uniref:PAS domain-containing protein n=1 Tax=Pelagibius sp. TaxID=1931238 RepID=UPI00261621CD|nr:PAS domain-containing protein [Pelagibius sp.]
MAKETGFWDGELPKVAISEKIRSFYRLWQDKRGDRIAPARSDFEVEDFRPWIGRLIIYEVVGEAEDFRYRLVGTDLVRVHGLDLTGRVVSEACYTAGNERTLVNLAEVCRRCEPRYRNDGQVTVKQWARAMERLFLPLSSDGRTVDKIICFVAMEEELVPRYERPDASSISWPFG